MYMDKIGRIYWSLRGFPRAFRLHILGTYKLKIDRDYYPFQIRHDLS